MSGNLFDGLWVKLRNKPGICAPTPKLEEIEEYLKKGQQYTVAASMSIEFTSVAPDVAQKLKSAAESINSVREGIAKYNNAAKDMSATCEIAQAIEVLNKWAERKVGNAEAAKAFDKLFGGAARFAEKLPGPLKQYAMILRQIALSQFFSNMQNLLDPEGNHPRGRALKEVMDSM
jgi:hypothetical protein